MFAIAVSSEAIARAVKIAAAAHLRRSAGRPPIATGPSAEIISVDIRKAPAWSIKWRRGARAGDPLHAASANRPGQRRQAARVLLQILDYRPRSELPRVRRATRFRRSVRKPFQCRIGWLQ